MGDEFGGELLRRLIHLTNDVANGTYDRTGEIFEYTKEGAYPSPIVELAEAFGMMIVKVEAREFQLEQMIDQLKAKNIELEATLKRVELLENIKHHLGKFVPESVKTLIERAPESPDLEKHERDVSVLFLDVAGYTKMSETFNSEDMNFLIEHYFSSFLDDIYRHEGDINETAGDGLMIVFQDDDKHAHAANAVSTALAITRRVHQLNHELEGRFQPVTLNFGINSGQALVGSSRFEGITGTRWTFTASGPVTNVAARIGGLASNGEVLIGQETADRTRGSFQVEEVGPRELKNVSEPVMVYRLVIE